MSIHASRLPNTFNSCVCLSTSYTAKSTTAGSNPSLLKSGRSPSKCSRSIFPNDFSSLAFPEGASGCCLRLGAIRWATAGKPSNPGRKHLTCGVKTRIRTRNSNNHKDYTDQCVRRPMRTYNKTASHFASQSFWLQSFLPSRRPCNNLSSA